MDALTLKGFIPIYMDKEGHSWKSYVCKRMGKLYRVLVVEDKYLAYKMLPFIQKQSCDDLVLQFYFKSCYCLVYSFLHGQRLSQRLTKDELNAKERNELVINILKELIKKRVDIQTSFHVLCSDNIIVTKTNQISFVYEPIVAEVKPLRVFNRLANLISIILGGKINKEAEMWLNKLKTMQFCGFHEAYFRLPLNLFEDELQPKVKKDDKLKQELFFKESVLYDGYWEFRRFYLKKRPILVFATIVMALVTAFTTIVLPYLNKEEKILWDFWSAGEQRFNVALDKHRRFL